MLKLESIDTALEQTLFKQGFVCYPLLPKEYIVQLQKLFYQYHPKNPEGFYASTHLGDKSLRKTISNEIIDIIAPFINQQFNNINALGAAFISKAPGEKGVLPLHQDWNIVNEDEARSYNLWIPLIDVNENNGAMRVLPNSHLKEKTFRGPNIPPTLYQISEEVDKHMKSLSMQAGEGLMYDHALWHSSPVNQSKELRLAIVIGIIPVGAKMRYYHKEGNQIMEHNSHSNFFFENDREEGHQNLELNRTFSYNFTILNKEEFEKVYLEKSSTKKKKGIFSFWKKSKI